MVQGRNKNIDKIFNNLSIKKILYYLLYKIVILRFKVSLPGDKTLSQEEKLLSITGKRADFTRPYLSCNRSKFVSKR